jgi:hypothetical protein
MSEKIYCKRCLSVLPDLPENLKVLKEPWLGSKMGQLSYATPPNDRCKKCGRWFDRSKPSTYRLRPFPASWEIIRRVVITTILGFGVAYAIAAFQMVQVIGGH